MMNRIVGFVGVAFLFFSCAQVKTEKKEEKEIKVETVQEDSTLLEIESVIPIDEEAIDLAEDSIFVTTATVLSIGEELIMPSDYLTTTMHVVTEKGDTLVFLNMSEDDASVGSLITIRYSLEKVDNALLCVGCDDYTRSVNLIDATLIPGEVVFKSLKLLKCTPDDYIVVNANFAMEDEAGNKFDLKPLDYKMLDDTVKMSEGFMHCGMVSQYYPVLESIQ